LIMASWNAISTRCSRDSPRLRMPPTQVSRPASRTASIVRSRPSRRRYSRAVAFLWCWAMFWVMHTGIIAAIATVCARYIGFFVPLSDVATKAVAVAAILVLSAINYVGVRHGSALQTAFTVIKVGAVVLIALAGFLATVTPPPTSEAAAVVPSLRAFTTAAVAGLFAFGGWHMVTYTGDETVDARRTIPRAVGARRIPITQQPVWLGDVEVRPGEILIGDDDGIVVLSDSELDAALDAAEAIQQREAAIRADILDGSSLFEQLNFTEHVDNLRAGRPSSLAFRTADA